uniref:SecY n=1 Tax=Schizymenia dubyi TaxID=38368 RepID=A0A0E3DAZ6_9FLOR|nr:SecY [Schizymenia dubyi]
MLFYYFSEFNYRLIYIFLSWILCVLILIIKIYILLLLETYPFFKIFLKKFLITHTTDLVHIMYTLILSTSLLFILPFIMYHLMQFCKSSWYRYQLKALKKIYNWSTLLFINVMYVCYLFFVPLILKFLIEWNALEKINSFLDITVELRLLNYIYWILQIRYYIGNFSFFLALFMLIFLFSMNIQKLYEFFNKYRKQIIFLNIMGFYIKSSWFFLQFFLIFFLLIFYELVFLFICYKKIKL